MARIKKISYRDIIHIKKLISVVCNDNVMSYRRLFFLSVPATFLQNFFYNIHLRKFPETYVVYDSDNILKGLITVKGQRGNPYKWQIKRLFLDKNAYDAGKQLVEYILAKFGARGVNTFYVSVDDNQKELADLFINGCGFRFCSNESLWKVSNINFISENIPEENFRIFKNSDAKLISDFYNENLITHYKYSHLKEKGEFKDRLIQGYKCETLFKYIYFDENKIKAFIEIKTVDNKNYFIDTIIAPQYCDCYNLVLSFAIKKIIKRNKNFNLYIKNRKYIQSGELLENFYKENRFELLQNNVILIKDFFKTVKEESHNLSNAVIFSGFEI